MNKMKLPSGLLSPEDNAKVSKMLFDKCQSQVTTVVQFYQANDSHQWQKILTGVACLTKDSYRRSYFIQIFDMDAGNLCWEQEIYNEFRINRPLNDVLVFEADEFMAALYFAEVGEADSFVAEIQNRLARLNRPKSGNTGKSASQNIGFVDGPGAQPGVFHTLNISDSKRKQKQVIESTQQI